MCCHLMAETGSWFTPITAVITVVIFVTWEAGTGSWSFLVGGGDLAAPLELAHDPPDDLASVGGEAEKD